ncbi:MAG: hypothetical protein AB8H79_04815, partial [Myxococcota bacterium]
MRIDLDRSLYSHCEQPSDVLPEHLDVLLQHLIADLVGAPVCVRRKVTYLQGAVTLDGFDHEFRMHAWVDLPEGHPTFAHADRGLVALVKPVSAEGLFGPTLGGVGWLGRPLGPWARLAEDDWVSEMIQAQGYLSIPGAEWMGERTDAPSQAMLAVLLGHHLAGMVNHRILE